MKDKTYYLFLEAGTNLHNLFHVLAADEDRTTIYFESIRENKVLQQDCIVIWSSYTDMEIRAVLTKLLNHNKYFEKFLVLKPLSKKVDLDPC